MRASGGLAPALSAVRTRLGLVALLFVVAALGWWWTGDQMRGMDNGPWTGLGAFGWFLGVWVVMMAAMMFPSVAPTVALYSRMTRQRSPLSPVLFAAGYLLTWAVAGVVAFGIGVALNSISGDLFAWDRAGRWTAGGTLVVAAVYELTPLKDVCLGKCRSPLGFAARLVARRLVRRASDGSQERRLVRRLLLGPHGVAVRVGDHERHVDGRRRRAHRLREDRPVAPGRLLRNRSCPPGPRACSC